MKSAKIFSILISAFLLTAGGRVAAAENLEQVFQNPPREAHPWVYWVLVGDTTEAAMTRDLEEMKAKGIVGCILYECQSSRGVNWWNRDLMLTNKDYTTVPSHDYPNPYYTPVPTGTYVTWSDHWRKMVRFA